MKKVILFIVVFFGFLLNVSAKDELVYEKKSSVEIGKIGFDIVEEGNSYLELGENVSFAYNFRKIGSNFFTHYGYGTYDSISVNQFTTVKGDYAFFQMKKYNDILYAVGINYDLYGYPPIKIFILDENFEVKETVDLPSNFISYNNWPKDFELTVTEDGKLYILDYILSDFIYGLSCEIAEVSNDYSTSTVLPCTIENIETYFPEVYEIYNNKGKFIKKDYLGDKRIVATSDKVEVYDKDKLLFDDTVKKENESYSNVKLLNDYVIVIKNIFVGTKSYDGIKSIEKTSYRDEILIYDYEGNLLQTSSDNSSYINIEVNRDKNSFVVLKRYVDGLCGSAYSGFLSCDNYLIYDVYEYNVNYAKEPEEDIKDKNEIIEEIVDKVTNPNTHDMIVLVFIILLISGAVCVFRKKIEF